MSKFADKLRTLSKSSTKSIGFQRSVSEPDIQRMLLVAGLSGTQVKEARTAVEGNADAVLILGDGSNAKIVKQVIEAAGDVPVGVFVKGMSEEKIDELMGLGCDFAVLDTRTSAAELHREGVGKFLMIEPSLDHDLVRAINSLEVEGVFLGSRGGDSPVAVEHLLVCRRMVELLEKPVITALPSLVTEAELTGLWQAGVDGVVVSSAQSSERLAGLRKMIGELPRGARGRRAKVGAALPHSGGVGAREEAEEQEPI